MAFTTFDPANKNSHITLSNGNLTATGDAVVAHHIAIATQFKSSGKWYFEATVNSVVTSIHIGVATASQGTADGQYVGGTVESAGMASSGAFYYNAIIQFSGSAFTAGDVIGVMLNLDGTPSIDFTKNGAASGSGGNYFSGKSWTPAISCYEAAGVTLNFGAIGWTYPPSAGYVGWETPDPTVGDGSVTLEEFTAYGSRVAAGAVTMGEFTAAGGYNGLGAVTLEQLVVAGAGGTKGGAVTLGAFTGAGTGRQENAGHPSLEPFVVSGTGFDSSINTVECTIPAPPISISAFIGSAITFAGTAPTPTIEIGTKDAFLTAPVPTLEAILLRGAVVTVAGVVPAPVLESSLDNPAIITVDASVRAPILSATLAPGQILTFTSIVRAPVISASSLTGNVATVLIDAVVPIIVAAWYSAYTITFAGTVSAPYLTSALSGAVTETYRTWVLNTRKGALTEYNNFSFNSFTTFNGQVLAAGSSGIVVLGTQRLDNATAITARVRSGKDSFRSSFHKRVPRAYIGYTTDGDMLFRMITTEGGERTYRLGWNHGTGVQQRRIPIGKWPRSRLWQWEFENESGADFSVGNVMLYPVVLRRRVI